MTGGSTGSNGRNVLLASKVFVVATWLVAVAGFLFPPSSPFGQIGRTLFYLLFAIHLLECVFFLRALRRTGRPLGMELANTLFFGVVHYTEVKQILEAKSAERDAPST